MGQPQFLWATHAKASASSEGRIVVLCSFPSQSVSLPFAPGGWTLGSYPSCRWDCIICFSPFRLLKDQLYSLPASSRNLCSIRMLLTAAGDEVMSRPQREGKEMGDKKVSWLVCCIRWCKQMCWGCCRACSPLPLPSAQPLSETPFKSSSCHESSPRTSVISN